MTSVRKKGQGQCTLINEKRELMTADMEKAEVLSEFSASELWPSGFPCLLIP